MNFGKEEMRRRSARVAVFHIHALVNHILRYCDYSCLSTVSCVCKTLYDFALETLVGEALESLWFGAFGRISVQGKVSHMPRIGTSVDIRRTILHTHTRNIFGRTDSSVYKL